MKNSSGHAEALTVFFFKKKIKLYPYIVYWPIDKIITSISNVQKEILNEQSIIDSIKPLLKSKEKYLITKTKKQAYRRWENDGLLRSSYEIYFYDRFISLFPLKSISIDKCYPNSNFRYDFMIDDCIYIEICPEYINNEKYKEKMDMKQKVFGCILLKTINDIDDFLERL